MTDGRDVAVGGIWVGAAVGAGGVIAVVSGSIELTAWQETNKTANNKNTRRIAQLYLPGWTGKIN